MAEYTVRWVLPPQKAIDDIISSEDRAHLDELLRKMVARIEREFWDALVSGYEVPPDVAEVMPRCMCGGWTVLHRPECPYAMGVI